MYIDYNHNSSFTDASELVYSYGPIYTLNGIPDTTFFVPLTALSGNTGMRVVLEEGDQVPSSCGTYTRGETEDYLVNIATIPACVGAPAADSTFSTLYSVCPGEDFTLSLKTYPAASGITYTWQQSTDNINYTSVPGIATTPIYVDTGGQTTGHYYRCKISCGGSFTYSYAIYISMNPFYKCYCNSSPSDPFTDTKIDTVKIGSISTGSDPNHCESYTDYTSLSTSLSIGIPAGIHIVNGSCDQQFYPAVVGVYIDYNQDGSFEIDSNELAYSYGPTTDLNSIPDGFITVPANAKLGTTGMRIILEEGDSVPSSCGNYIGGETEDYVVNIVGAGTCTDPPNPGTATASITSICSGSLPLSFTVSLTGNSGGPGETYQWQSSTDGINFTDIPGQTTSTATETINGGGVTTYYRVQVHCGATTLPSASVTVTVNPSPVGNTIGDPIVVNGFPYITDGNNLASNCWTSNYDTTSKQPSPDVFYQVFTNGDIGSLQVSTCQTADLNTYIHILNASQSHLHSNDNNGPLCTGVEASDTTVLTDALNQYYYVVVEGKDTLQGTYHLEIHFITATDISPSGSPASEILIFPNPNNGTFNLTVNLNQNITDIATLSITNSIGQQLSEQKVTVVN